MRNSTEAGPTTSSPDERDDTQTEVVQSYHRRLRRMMARVIVAFLLVTSFILVLGDMRRRNVPMAHAREYARQLQDRQGGLETLPLNLEFVVPFELREGVHRFEHLSREQARRLRGTEGPILIGHTRHLTRVLLPDGYAAVVMDDHVPTARWLSVDEFKELESRREKALQDAND